MSIFYLDYENGDDVSDGTSWANAWKTLTNGATSSRIAPGDIIRVAKSANPNSIGNATWTDGYDYITFSSAQNKNIDLCNSSWVQSTNVTITLSTSYRKEGSYNNKIDIASDFVIGKIAYSSFTSSDFSSYQGITFWIRSSIAIPSGTLKINLCSDSNGDTSVNAFTINESLIANRITPINIDAGGNLGSSIQSISINAISDPGTVTLYIDDFVAYKSSGVHLNTLISKNSNTQGGSEPWFIIQSINGATIYLDNGSETTVGNSKKYSGTTETVTTYTRTAITAMTTGYLHTLNDSGNSSNYIEIQGGYDVATTIQSGETYFDGKIGQGSVFYSSAKSYFKINHISAVRYSNGFYIRSGSNNFFLQNCQATGCNYGFYFYSSYLGNISNTNACYNSTYGFYLYGINSTIINAYSINSNSNYGIYSYDSAKNKIKGTDNNRNQIGLYIVQSDRNTFDFDYIKNNIDSAIYIKDGSSNNHFKNFISGGNVSHCINTNFGENYCKDVSMVESSEIYFSNSYRKDIRIYSQNHDKTANNDWIFTDYGSINKQSTTRHSTSGYAWKFNLNSSYRTSNYPLELEIGKIIVNANKLVTFKAWVKKDHATNVGAKLICEGGQIAGVSSDVEDVKANDTNWEELSITFTPTEIGVVVIKLQTYYISGTSYVYVDDLTIQQAT